MTEPNDVPTSRPASHGVRDLRLDDQAPNCDIVINGKLFDLEELAADRVVLDIGCGQGALRASIEQCGGRWIGIEPFLGGAHLVQGSAEMLSIRSNSIDLVVMDAVLEHIPDVGRSFAEVGRVLKPGGKFVGYVAFMECFHEISYSHLSFKALEHYAAINGLRLTAISGGKGFGIDYHLRVLLHPLPMDWTQRPIAGSIRTIIRVKALCGRFAMRSIQKRDADEARRLSELFYKIECLRQSHGFSYIIEKHDESLSGRPGGDK